MSTPGKTDQLPRPEGAAAWLIVAAAFLFLGFFLLMPIAAVFAVAFSKGIAASWAAIATPDTWAAAKLTLLCMAIAVPLNTAFGIAAAWAVTKFEFRGRALLISLIDIPFTVSPVVAGLLFVLLFGARGTFGPWLIEHNLRVIYAIPGVVLATLFVTFPFVARELIPLMQTQGDEEELAAITLGAGGWQTFFRITLPNIKWGLLYGVVVCSARALGEFGAVSVVSGHVRGETNTLPLHVEILYNEYDQVGAFSVASMLTLIAVVALVAKKLLAWKTATTTPEPETTP